jgi:hypothetical protein
MPHEPQPSAEYVFGRMLEHRSEWADYLNGW